MSNEAVPGRAQPLLPDQPTTPWEDARDRMASPGPDDYSHAWLATVRPDGRPHLMPVISFWIDGAPHFIVGEGTRGPQPRRQCVVRPRHREPQAACH